jgi:hypothetical protein
MLAFEPSCVVTPWFPIFLTIVMIGTPSSMPAPPLGIKKVYIEREDDLGG